MTRVVTLLFMLVNKILVSQFILANDAANFVKMGTNTVVITAEMAAHKFVKRIGSNFLLLTLMNMRKRQRIKITLKDD